MVRINFYWNNVEVGWEESKLIDEALEMDVEAAWEESKLIDAALERGDHSPLPSWM